jgi:hypothetical protein
VRPVALKIWAFTHGMTGLIASGTVSVMEAGQLSKSAVQALLGEAGIQVPENSFFAEAATP